jgi:hypothetical protein
LRAEGCTEAQGYLFPSPDFVGVPLYSHEANVEQICTARIRKRSEVSPTEVRASRTLRQ